MPSAPARPKLLDWNADPRVIQVRERVAQAEAKARELQDLLPKAHFAADQLQAQATETRTTVGLGLVNVVTEKQAAPAEKTANEARQARAETERLIAEHTPQVAALRKLLAETEDAARLSVESDLHSAYTAAKQHLSDALEGAVDAHAEMLRIFLHAEDSLPQRWQSADGTWHSSVAGVIVQTWPATELTFEHLDDWRRTARASCMLASGDSPHVRLAYPRPGGVETANARSSVAV